MKVYFIGAGPGDPELMTVKGARLMREAEVVIYAGSLVNPAVLGYAREGAEITDSSTMTLEQIVTNMEIAVAAGKRVARLHTGDPSLYGAIREQIDLLEEKGIAYEIIPGVSSFLAAAAALQREYTVPDGSQTLILTRMEGRTPVPEREKLRLLASHGASLCIFLSVHMIEEVTRELAQGYALDTPVAIVEKASWPEEKVITGTLADIAARVKAAGIRKTAIILVGEFLEPPRTRSRLYNGSFTHAFRRRGGGIDVRR